MQLGKIAQHLNAELQGDASCDISGIATLEQAQPGQISILKDPRHEKYLAGTKASAVVLPRQHQSSCPAFSLVVDHPELAFARLSRLFERRPKPYAGIHPSAVLGENCRIGQRVSIGANCVLGDGVWVGDDTVIHPGCVVGEETKIGNDCYFWANVTVYHRVQIGNRVMLHSGVVVGADGFGLARTSKGWEKIAQLAGVVIEDDVEVGANTTIDRGALQNTMIGRGVKLDNQIQIAHNVQIGENTAIAGCTAIAGSAKIGKNCMIAGAVRIAGHLEICDQTILTGGASVTSSITEPGIYSSGMLIQPNKAWRKSIVYFRHFEDFVKRLRKLENKQS